MNSVVGKVRYCFPDTSGGMSSACHSLIVMSYISDGAWPNPSYYALAHHTSCTNILVCTAKFRALKPSYIASYLVKLYVTVVRAPN